MLGVFLALDFFLFYVFWEVMLLPMYFLIGVWGGPRREYAAIKFFLYTLLGSVLMLIAILMLYFNSDLRTLSDEQLIAAHVVPDQAACQAAWRAENPSAGPAADVPRHTFNILALCSNWGSIPISSAKAFLLKAGKSIQWWAFVLLFHRFCDQGPQCTGAYVVTRRARGGPHTHLDDSGRACCSRWAAMESFAFATRFVPKPLTIWHGSFVSSVF